MWKSQATYVFLKIRLIAAQIKHPAWLAKARIFWVTVPLDLGKEVLASLVGKQLDAVDRLGVPENEVAEEEFVDFVETVGAEADIAVAKEISECLIPVERSKHVYPLAVHGRLVRC